MTEPATDTEQLADSIKEHVLNMLKMTNEINRLEEKYNDLQNELKSIATLKTGLIKEYKDSKKLLDHCLDTGQDPIQTKLSYTTDELTSFVPITSKSFNSMGFTRYLLDPLTTTSITSGGGYYTQPYVTFSGKVSL